MKTLASLLLTFLVPTSIFTQSIVGTWKTIDDKEGIEKSYITIYEENDKLFGKVSRLLNADEDSVCEKCTGENKDKAILGMVILWDMTIDDDEWSGGRILDPESGKDYSCILKLESDKKLKVRGYIGTPFIGRTQYWYLVEE